MATNLALTAHAGKRLQQRGIRAQAWKTCSPTGQSNSTITGRASTTSTGAGGGADGTRKADSLDGIYAVVSADGAVVTVGHRRRRIFQDRKRGAYPWHAS